MRIHPWYTAFSAFFVVLLILGLSWLARTDRLIAWVPPFDLFLMALAVFRLVRLTTYDVITQFVRDWFVGADPRTLPGTLGALITCPWCTGLWYAFIVAFAYFATPYAWFVIFVLALAALGSFFQVLANLIGWHAEGKKHEVLGRPG